METLPGSVAMIDEPGVRRDHGFHSVPVRAVVDETHDTRSFVLDVPDDLRDTFRYRAGQFCTFRAHLAGDDVLRCYSMSSAPETDPDLTVTVKRVTDGVVSNWFNDRVRAGDVLEVTKPAGVFCVRDGDHPIVAFCGGSGVTPVMSIVKSVLTTSPRLVRMLYANRDRTSVIFAGELDHLRNRHDDRFELRHHLDVDTGFVDAADIATFVGDTVGADFYICGPGPFMDLVETTLRDLGVDADHILIERFVVPDPAAPPAPGATTPDGTGTDEGSDVPESITLILGGKSHTVGYRPGDTILETARRGGVPAPYSCESGNCATCMALLREGTAAMRVNNALTPDEVDEGWILTCQSVPSGVTVTVEYEAL
jgi:3-ketosteroid 9alpha-monooxygenase subunit B